MKNTVITPADLTRPDHQRAVAQLVNAYATDPMGNNAPLAPEVQTNLIPALRNHPTTLIMVAFQGEQAVGIAICFIGLSTFAAQPLINVHDLYVVPAMRGRGICRTLLESVEAEAKTRGCCKLTLEVLENNFHARSVYERLGYAPPVYAGKASATLFLAKELSS